MTTPPDFIFASPAWARTFDERNDPIDVEYVRRDPAVLAELPEVRELLAAAQWCVGTFTSTEHERLKRAIAPFAAAIREARNG